MPRKKKEEVKPLVVYDKAAGALESVYKPLSKLIGSHLGAKKIFATTAKEDCNYAVLNIVTKDDKTLKCGVYCRVWEDGTTTVHRLRGIIGKCQLGSLGEDPDKLAGEDCTLMKCMDGNEEYFLSIDKNPLPCTVEEVAKMFSEKDIILISGQSVSMRQTVNEIMSDYISFHAYLVTHKDAKDYALLREMGTFKHMVADEIAKHCAKATKAKNGKSEILTQFPDGSILADVIIEKYDNTVEGLRIYFHSANKTLNYVEQDKFYPMPETIGEVTGLLEPIPSRKEG